MFFLPRYVALLNNQDWIYANFSYNISAEPCQLPGGNATQNHSDQHTGHTTVHSDGTPHSHGDIHHDHANDGQADAETVDGPGNAAYTVTFRNYSYLLIFAVIYFCNFRKFSK